jgi:hypothetical protein
MMYSTYTTVRTALLSLFPLLRTDHPLLPPTRGDAAVAAVSCGAANIRRRCYC